MCSTTHPELQNLRETLQEICSIISDYQPMTPRPPIIDSSLEFEATDENHWLQPEHIPGIKKLREAIKMDLEALENFLQDPASEHLPALSTNAPYLVSVWNELLCAPAPVSAVMKMFQPSVESGPRRQGPQKPNGVKVDVVADNGRKWIRVNTIKNSRLMAEFREIDSYFTSSDDDSDNEVNKPRLAQKEFDNSVLRMGRYLLHAAKANPIDGTSNLPRVTLRLTRLDPLASTENDPRIAQTIQILQDMGIDIELGERAHVKLPPPHSQTPSIFKPTTRLNLDLSILIALVSDLTHSPLPTNVEEANARFIPTRSYREWKQERNKAIKKKKGSTDETHPHDHAKSGRDLKHSRALSNQLLQEMSRGLLNEMHEQLTSAASSTSTEFPPVEFWTTAEARDRCIRIISKIGGVNEKRRAHALFPSSGLTCADVSSIDLAEELFWRGSRFPHSFVPILPIRIFPSTIPAKAGENPSGPLSFPSQLPPFLKTLGQTCRYILSQETMPHPRALPEHLATDEIQRASVTKANPRLTAHTVESLLWGAELGWTTLTANKSSVKAILREMKAVTVASTLDAMDGENGAPIREEVNTSSLAKNRNEDENAAIWVVSSEDIAGDRKLEDKGGLKAALWVVDPRSLAEGMRSDYTS